MHTFQTLKLKVCKSFEECSPTPSTAHFEALHNVSPKAVNQPLCLLGTSQNTAARRDLFTVRPLVILRETGSPRVERKEERHLPAYLHVNEIQQRLVYYFGIVVSKYKLTIRKGKFHTLVPRGQYCITLITIVIFKHNNRYVIKNIGVSQIKDQIQYCFLKSAYCTKHQAYKVHVAATMQRTST